MVRAPRHPANSLSEVSVAFLWASILLAIAGDLGAILRWGPSAEVVALLVLLAGASAAVPAWRHRLIGAAACLCALAHACAFLVATAIDDRTFFGGAMFRVVAMFAWVLVTVLLLTSTLLGRWTHIRRRPQ